MWDSYLWRRCNGNGCFRSCLWCTPVVSVLWNNKNNLCMWSLQTQLSFEIIPVSVDAYATELLVCQKCRWIDNGFWALHSTFKLTKLYTRYNFCHQIYSQSFPSVSHTYFTCIHDRHLIHTSSNVNSACNWSKALKYCGSFCVRVILFQEDFLYKLYHKVAKVTF